MYSRFDKMPETFRNIVNELGGISRGKEKYVFRKNVNNPFPDTGAYFGCINEGEDNTGAYSDLSIVVFPSNEEESENDRWIIALGVGSLGYKNDYELVSLPGTRRLFTKHLANISSSFVKNDFMDIETEDGFKSFCDRENIPETLANAVKNYRKVLIACSILNPNDESITVQIMKVYLAIYSTLRGWPNTKANKKEIQKVLTDNELFINEVDEATKLLKDRKYIVLQGAPGTGKTRLAKEIVKNDPNKIVFFTQFHAETSYSDFIYSIIPNVEIKELNYSTRYGILVDAINAARAEENKNKNIYLIIDEINRANLSNVLGPIFYLFEPTMSDSDVKIQVCPGLELNKLPDNLYVIATMNTADRRLAMVDFALRRRFAWYTLFPHKIEADNGKKFCEEEFSEITAFFEKYATDEELNLQPGHAYFIVSGNNDAEFNEAINSRLKYEIMPLIKEYLADGLLPRAKDDFVNYFRDKIHEEMYR